jgi:predicted NAD-dependent protein-ADP-ribosyltransferase YbiA (DUF1768 family)
MFDKSLCLNINHPDVKKWIDSIGKENMYKVFVQNGYFLPDYESYSESEQTSSYSIEQIKSFLDKLVPANQYEFDTLNALKSKGFDIQGTAAFYKKTFFFRDKISKNELAEEAFHAIIQTLMDNDEKSLMYNAGRELLTQRLKTEKKSFNEYIKELQNKFPNISNEVLEQYAFEEEIVKDFVNYYNSEGKSNRYSQNRINSLTKKLSFLGKNAQKVAELLHRLYEKIKALFNLTSNETEILALFDKISRGEYKNNKIVNNNDNVIPSFRLYYNSENKSIPSDEISQMKKSIAVLAKNIYESEGIEVNKDSIIDLAIEKYSEFLEQQANLEEDELKQNTLVDLLELLEKKDSNLTEEIQEQIEANKTIFDNDENEEDEKGKTQNYDENANQQSLESRSKELQILMNTTGKIQSSLFIDNTGKTIAYMDRDSIVTDLDGNVINENDVVGTKIDILEIADEKMIYSAIVRKLSNTYNENERLSKLIELSLYNENVQKIKGRQDNENTRTFINALLKDVIVDISDENKKKIINQLTGDKPLSEILNTEAKPLHVQRFLLSLRGFNLATRSVYRTEIDIENGWAKVSDVESSSKRNNQKNFWNSNYRELQFKKEFEVYKSEFNDSFIKLENKIKLIKLEQDVIGIATEYNNLLNLLGIDVSGEYLFNFITDLIKGKNAKLLNKQEFVLDTLFAKMKFINDFLKESSDYVEFYEADDLTTENTKLANDDKDFNSFFNFIADGNIEYDERVIETSYKDGNNNSIYLHQNPTFTLKFASGFKSEKDFKKMKEGGVIAIKTDGSVIKSTILDSFKEENPLNDMISINGVLEPKLLEQIKLLTLDTTQIKSYSYKTKDGFLIEKDSEYTEKNILALNDMGAAEYALTNLILLSENAKSVTINGKEYLFVPVSLGHNEASKQIDYLMIPFDKNSYNNKKLSEEAKNHVFKLIKTEYDKIQENHLNLKNQLEELKITDGNEITRNDLYKLKEYQNVYEGYNVGKFTREKLEVETEGIIVSTEYYKAGEEGFKGLKFSPEVEPFINNDLLIAALTGKELNIDDIDFNTVTKFLEEEYQWVKKQGLLDKLPHAFRDKSKGNDTLGKNTTNVELFNPKATTENKLKTALFNYWLGSTMANRMRYGSHNFNFKLTSSEAYKRSRMFAGATLSTKTSIKNESLGIYDSIDQITYAIIEEPLAVSDNDKKNIKHADGAMKSTPKGLRKILHGTTKLTKRVSDLLDKTEQGVDLTPEEWDEMVNSDSFLSALKPLAANGEQAVKVGLNPTLTIKSTSVGTIIQPTSVNGNEFTFDNNIIVVDKYGRTFQTEGNTREIIWDNTNKVFKEWKPRLLDKNLINYSQRMFLNGYRKMQIEGEESIWVYRGKAYEIDTIIPPSALKTSQHNILPFKEILDDNNNVIKKDTDFDFADELNSKYTFANAIDADYFGEQVQNPQGKVKITTPTQNIEILSNELTGDISIKIFDKRGILTKEEKLSADELVKLYEELKKSRNINGKELAVKELFKQVKNEKGEVIKQIPDYKYFFDGLIEGLKLTGGSGQDYEFLATDPITKEPLYNVNIPLNKDKMIQSVVKHFSTGVLSHKVAGNAYVLASDHGVRVLKKLIPIKENGVIVDYTWEVINNKTKGYDQIIIENKPEDLSDLIYDHRDWYLEQKRKEKSKSKKVKQSKTKSKSEFHMYFESPEMQARIANGDEIYFSDSLRYMKKSYIKQGDNYVFNTWVSEAMMPKLNGKQTSIMDSIRFALGVRIPSQDKQSSINIEWVDFLDDTIGNTIVVPKEIVQIAGSDFDIDKVFSTQYEGYWENGEFIKYEDTFQDYKKWIFKSSKAAKLALKEKLTNDPVYNTILEDVKNNKILLKEQRKYLKPYFEILKPEVNRAFDKINELQNSKQELLDRATVLFNRLSGLSENLPDNIKELQTEIKSYYDKLKETKNKEEREILYQEKENLQFELSDAFQDFYKDKKDLNTRDLTAELKANKSTRKSINEQIEYIYKNIEEYKTKNKDFLNNVNFYFELKDKDLLLESQKEFIREKYYEETLKQFDLISTKEEFQEKSKILKKVHKNDFLNNSLNNAVLNNKILDLQRAMLTSDSVLFGDVKNPARGTGDISMDLSLIEDLQENSKIFYSKSKSLEEIEKIYNNGEVEGSVKIVPTLNGYDVYPFQRIINGKETDLLNIEKNKSIPHNSISTHSNYQQGTIIARQGIGIVVNGALVAIVANRIGLSLSSKFKFNYNGNPVKFGYTNHLQERVFSVKNTLTSTTTDEAKEEQLKRHGIKGDDLNVIDLLTSLEFSLDEAIAIVNSKIVKKYKDSVSKNKIESRAEKNKKLTQEEREFNVLVQNLKITNQVNLTEQKIFESLYNDDKDILATYLKVGDMSKEISKLAKLIKGKKGYTKGNLSELTDVITTAVELGLINKDEVTVQISDKNTTNFFNWESLKNSDKALDIKSFVKITEDLVNDNLSQMFIEYESISKKLKNAVLINTNKKDDTDLQSKIEKDVNSFLIIQLLKMNVNPNNSYIIDFLNFNRLNPLSGEENFLDKFFENKSKKGYDLLKHIIGIKGKVNTLKNSETLDSLRLASLSKLNPAQQDNIRNLFLEMYTSPNEKEKQFAKDLFAYFILKDGLQFRQYNISKIFPTIMFREISKVLDNFKQLKELSEKEESVMTAKFKSLWFSDIKNKKHRLKIKDSPDTEILKVYRFQNNVKVELDSNLLQINQPPLYLEINKNGEERDYTKIGVDTKDTGNGLKLTLPQYIDYRGASYKRIFPNNKIEVSIGKKSYSLSIKEIESEIDNAEKYELITNDGRVIFTVIQSGDDYRIYNTNEELIEGTLDFSKLPDPNIITYMREPYYGSTITDLTIDAGLIPATTEVNSKKDTTKSEEENRSKLEDLINQLEQEGTKTGYIQFYKNLLSNRYSPNFDKGYNEGMNNQNEEIQNITDEIYSKLEKKTQSLNVVLPKDLGLVYNSKTFWSEFFPEFKANYGDQVIVAYRGNSTKSFAENFRSNGVVQRPVTIGNPFDIKEETGTAKEKGIKATKKFIDWLITGNNYDIVSATAEYRNLIINNIKNGELKGRPIGYYEEKNYATHATALDYLINEYDWNSNVNINFKPFKVETKVQIDAEKAPFKSERANGGFIGFGRNNSSTEFYAEQYQNRNAPVNPSVYEIGKTYFASINGGTSYTEKDFTNRDKAFQEIVKALNSGAFVLLDSKSYIDKGKGYNKLGEGWIHDELNKLGFKNTDSTINPDVTKWENPNINQAQPASVVDKSNKINIYAGTGENAELSNFAERPVTIGDQTFRTPEGAFQAMKIWFTNAVLLNTPASKENLKIVEQLKNASGSQAKALGRKITDLSQATWDRDSSGIMKNILTLSFKQNPNALTKLLATGDATLTHTQDKTKWGKEFPKLLMEVREELKVVSTETSNIQGTQSEVVGDISQEQLKLLQELQEVEARLETFLDTTDGIFYRYFKNGGRIKPESFDNLIDKNKRSTATNGAYIRKDGMSYDTLARAAYAMVNREETADDKAVVNLEEFILNYPNTWQTPYDNLKNNKKQIESELEILKTKGCQ